MDFNIECRKCGSRKNIHLHHKIPLCIGGKDIDGRVYLCDKCHHILHNMLPKVIMQHVEKKEECRLHVLRTTNWFVEKGENK